MTVLFTLMGLGRGQFIWWLVAAEFVFCTAFMTWAVKTDWKPRFLPWPRNPDPLFGHREDAAAEPQEGDEDEPRSRRGFFSAGFSGRKPS